jgi:hypothetical protein
VIYFQRSAGILSNVPRLKTHDHCPCNVNLEFPDGRDGGYFLIHSPTHSSVSVYCVQSTDVGIRVTKTGMQFCPHGT